MQCSYVPEISEYSNHRNIREASITGQHQHKTRLIQQKQTQVLEATLHGKSPKE